MIPQFEKRMRNRKWLGLLVWGTAIFAASWFFLNPHVQEPLSDLLWAENTGQHLVGAPMPVESPALSEPVEPPAISEPVYGWRYVQRDLVRIRPLVNGKCSKEKAVMHVYRGDKVLVVRFQGPWAEIEHLVRQGDERSNIHKHGCIHESLLGWKKVSGQDDG